MKKGERDELIEEYGRGFELLSAALAALPRQAWEFKPAPREWSIHEIVIHMADSEAMGVIRARMLIAQPGTTLMSYDDAKWAAGTNYSNQSLEDGLQLFKLHRQITYHLLKTLPEGVFAQSAVHPEGNIYPEYGEGYTLDKWLQIYTHHVGEHIEQMKNTYRAWQEKSH